MRRVMLAWCAAAARALGPVAPRLASKVKAPPVVKAKRASSVERPLFQVGKAKAVHRGTGVAAPRYDGEQIAASGLPDRTRPYLVLGVETSCDDTAAAVVRSDGVVLGEAVASQHEVHAQYGGVVPGLAKLAHEEAIEDVVRKALERAGLEDPSDVDAVAATVGPGLEICLRVGARAAARIASQYDKPFLHTHHLESHCLVSRLGGTGPRFPFLSLLVSGGHCQLLWVRGVGDFAVMGGTLDDALGEAYDKAARMLGLAGPTGGGPALERAAARGNATAVALPIPMQKKKNCDFSYAGLKNALRGRVAEAREELGLEEADPLPEHVADDLAASFQRVAIRHVEDRLKYAFAAVAAEAGGADGAGEASGAAPGADDAPTEDGGADARPTLALVGGVAANTELRTRVGDLCAKHGWELAVPPPRLCTDNGVMVAWAAVEKANLGFSDPWDDEVEVVPRWPFREWDRGDGAS